MDAAEEVAVDSGVLEPEQPARSRLAAAMVDRSVIERVRTVKTSGSRVGHSILPYLPRFVLNAATRCPHSTTGMDPRLFFSNDL
ncbi:hypothetical protein ACI3KS_06805 [Microbacterium sp. ZW T5_45]|uniref:hypothetical protein n=1 Tax=Microbacterium sp. ZW T5_45 TaxID=3378080 RepID=UPI0038539394